MLSTLNILVADIALRSVFIASSLYFMANVGRLNLELVFGLAMFTLGSVAVNWAVLFVPAFLLKKFFLKERTGMKWVFIILPASLAAYIAILALAGGHLTFFWLFPTTAAYRALRHDPGRGAAMLDGAGML